MRYFLLFLPFTISIVSSAQLQMQTVEKIIYSAVYIENTGNDGLISSGTGFNFTFKVKSGDSLIQVPAIITNKHVLENAKILRFVIHSRDEKGLPKDNDPIIFPMLGNSDLIFPHPKNIDLCAILINPFLNEMENKKLKPSYVSFSEDNIPNDSLWNQLLPIEEVYMIGYPSGLFDRTSYLPIVRKGITATNSSKSLNNKNEFMVDIAAFSGSSGSPVFILNQGNFSAKDGSTIFGTRFLFIGILYSQPLANVQGNLLNFEPVPFEQRRYQSQVPMNLGYVIKSTELREIQKEIEKKVNLKK